jgi:hypothetical protein
MTWDAEFVPSSSHLPKSLLIRCFVWELRVRKQLHQSASASNATQQLAGGTSQPFFRDPSSVFVLQTFGTDCSDMLLSLLQPPLLAATRQHDQHTTLKAFTDH